ncbi:hypothetical protein KSS87_005981 [Heliosperma pusillum]|nr:hypothetical protein KSS87_005981 [Heliosperma pusillum]
MKGKVVKVLLFLMVMLISAILCASARNAFFVSEEGSIGNQRMLRGVSLNDYEDVGANTGHDPGANTGHDPGNRDDSGARGGRRSENP